MLSTLAKALPMTLKELSLVFLGRAESQKNPRTALQKNGGSCKRDMIYVYNMYDYIYILYIVITCMNLAVQFLKP